MYLEKEQIDYLLRQARDPVWRMGVFSKFPKHWYDVMSLSPAKLIYFKGNSSTGFTHIQERHGFYSQKNYFGAGALGNPSKFSKQSYPLIDYMNIVMNGMAYQYDLSQIEVQFDTIEEEVRNGMDNYLKQNNDGAT